MEISDLRRFNASGDVHFTGICLAPLDIVYTSSSTSRESPKSDIFTMFSLPSKQFRAAKSLFSFYNKQK